MAIVSGEQHLGKNRGLNSMEKNVREQRLDLESAHEKVTGALSR